MGDVRRVRESELEAMRQRAERAERERDTLQAAQRQGEASQSVNRLRELIDQYWDIAWREGNDGRRHDTEEGVAQECINEIEGVLEQMEADQRQGGEAVAWRVSHPEKGWNVYRQYPLWAEADFTIQPLYTATQPAARQDAERALRSGLQVMPDPKGEAITKALADYAKGDPIDQIMRELKNVERDNC